MQEGQGHGDACQGPRRLLRPDNVQHGWILCEAALRMWGREDGHVKDTCVSNSWGWQDLALMWVLMLTAWTDNSSHNFYLQGDCSPRWLPSQRPPPDMSQPASLFSLVIPAMMAFSNCEPNKPFLKLLWPPWLHLHLYLSRSGDNSRVLRQRLKHRARDEFGSPTFQPSSSLRLSQSTVPRNPHLCWSPLSPPPQSSKETAKWGLLKTLSSHKQSLLVV